MIPAPRFCQGYEIIQSEVIGNIEIVLAESKTAPDPFITWRRSMDKDAKSGTENFYWGHPLSDLKAAEKDFRERIYQELDALEDRMPSITAQIKHYKRYVLPTEKKDVPPERRNRIDNSIGG